MRCCWRLDPGRHNRSAIRRKRRLIVQPNDDWSPILWRAVKCTRCSDIGWVCEMHDDLPWDGEHECGCGAAGMPCLACNPSDKDHPPRLPKGFERDDSSDDD
jgi:hypothetical protein